MIDYGFQRLALINSAGYKTAFLPLDEAVSLIGPNNRGKTTLINAIQFLLVINKQKMDFGDHSLEQTRALYFPNNSAYILLEVLLPQTGTVVFGCVGEGVSHQYEYFAYKGSLRLEDYASEDGNTVKQPNLLAHFAQKGITVHRFNPTDFQAMIYGSRASKAAGMPDFSVFKLENSADSQIYQQVLTRTLRLDRLDSASIKAYLIQIFRHDLPDTGIDFKAHWEKNFATYNEAHGQYQAMLRQKDVAASLEVNQESRLILRGKLLDWRSRLNTALQDWHAWHAQALQSVDAESTNLLRAQQKRVEVRDECLIEKTLISQRIAELSATEAQAQTWQTHFELIHHRQHLLDRLASASAALDTQITLLGGTQGMSIEVINTRLKAMQADIALLDKRLKLGDESLQGQLQRGLSSAAWDAAQRVLSGDVLALPATSTTIDVAPLNAVLTPAGMGESSSWIHLPGLSINLNDLPEAREALTVTQLVQARSEALASLALLRRQHAVALDRETAQTTRERLSAAVKEAESELVNYDAWQALRLTANLRQAEVDELQQKLAAIAQFLVADEQQQETLATQLSQIAQRRQNFLNQKKDIDREQRLRIDSGSAFMHLADMAHHPWLVEPEWKPADVADRLAQYQRDCRALLDLNRELAAQLTSLHAGGLTKFQDAESEEDEIGRIVRFAGALSNEKAIIDRMARSAVVDVAGRLRTLRDNLLAFKGKMRDFNQLINRRKLSDLAIFKIDVIDEAGLVEAIETVIDVAEKAEQGETMALFNQQGPKLDDARLQQAKERLISEGNARNGLHVSDLFRLAFSVGRQGEAVRSFPDIDSAASNGTVLMAKLITGLALLHLMQDKRQQLRAICYLDEAASLDEGNQRSLIESAREFGFTLIYASPTPAPSATYCVPISSFEGNKFISEKHWLRVDPLAVSP